MDIQCSSTGKVFYKIDPQIGALLCEALPSVFVPVRQAVSTSFQMARWVLSEMPRTGERFLSVKCDACKREDNCSWPVERLHQFEKQLCAHAGTCPENIRQQYAALYTKPLKSTMPAEFFRPSSATPAEPKVVQS